MKSLLLKLFALVTINAQAHEFHTPNYCHTQNNNLCAHFGFHAEPNSQDAFEFIVDLVAPNAVLATVESVSVTPIMRMDSGHEHGTSPVTVTRLDLNHFQVSDVYLIMPGQWIIQVNVHTTGGNWLLEIPLLVKP